MATEILALQTPPLLSLQTQEEKTLNEPVFKRSPAALPFWGERYRREARVGGGEGLACHRRATPFPAFDVYKEKQRTSILPS